MKSDLWSKISSMSEIVSSVAVLATLVYLAIQTHEVSVQTALNSSAILSSSRQEILNAELDHLYTRAQSLAFKKYRTQGFGNITDEERLEVRVIFIAYFRMRENLWFQYQQGVLDESTWNSYFSQLIRTLEDNGDVVAQIWSSGGTGISQEFMDFVNTELDRNFRN